MDNELHAIEQLEKCTSCYFWRQFDPLTGFCDKFETPYDETKYDFTCEHWREIICYPLS